jgi:hypothetical protein
LIKIGNVMKRILSILFVCGFSLLAFGSDEVEFKASAPAQVVAGRPFQLTYSINKSAKDLRAPEFVDFEYIAGPYTAQSSSTSYVNGKRTSSYTLTYTYMLQPLKEGTFTLSPATIKVDGKQYTSNGVRVKVLPPDQEPTQSASNAEPQGEVFLRTVVSKTKVHEQEAILLTYKIYFAGLEVSQLTNNISLPDFKGFIKQEIEQSSVQAELENYKGKNYQTAELYSILLFPQNSGDITIDPARFEAVVRVQNRSRVRSIFDDFYATVTQVRQLEAPSVKIHVDPLPANKPVSYSGGVGNFTIDTKMSNTKLQVNEAVTYTLTIRGSGNLKYVKTPAIEWPEGFEVYDPKVTNNFDNTRSGISGTKVIEYLAIPSAGGTYTLPTIEFSYFDVKNDAYNTLRTSKYDLEVSGVAAPNQSSNHSASTKVNTEEKDDKKQSVGSDIQYINIGEELTVYKPAKIEFGSFLFWLCYLMPLCITIILFIIFRKRIKENADITLVRYKKANQVAKRRLKTAKRLLQENNKELFYEEIERASWTYLSDRLSISTADLNKENISHILSDKGVNEALIQEVNHVLSTAEFARYAPTSDHAMQDMYKDTTQMINNLESQKL